MTEIKAVMLDFDGVCGDTLENHLRFCVDQAKRCGLDIPVPDLFAFARMVESPMEALLRNYGFPANAIPDLAFLYEKDFASNYPIRLFDGIVAMIYSIKNNGMKVGVVSANRRVNIAMAFGKDFGLLDFCVTIETYTDRVKRLQEAIRICAVRPEEAVFVFDMPADWGAAVRAGVNPQPVGYGWQLRPVAIPDSVEKLQGIILNVGCE